MIDLDKEDMEAVERAFAEDERSERRELVLDVIDGVLTVVGAIAFLALCWLLIRIRETEDAERRARDPHGAEAVKPLGTYSMAPTLTADRVISA